MKKKLKVWTDGVDFFVAYSKSDCWKMRDELHGNSEFEENEFEVLCDEEFLKLHDEDHPDGPIVEQTCSAWCSENGRGLLCSTEY